jgi:hypothetical protein
MSSGGNVFFWFPNTFNMYDPLLRFTLRKDKFLSLNIYIFQEANLGFLILLVNIGCLNKGRVLPAAM